MTSAHLKSASNILVTVVFMTASFVFLCWMLGNDLGRGFLSTRMKANSALALIASAASLALQNYRPFRRKSELLGHVLAFIPLAIGALALCEYLTNAHTGMNELFALDPNPTETLMAHGLMAPNSAFCFVMLGLSLIFLDGKTWLNRLAQRFAIVSCCVSVFSIFGYLFEVQALYKISLFIRMSHYTAFSISLISLGVILARPQNGIVNLLLRKSATGHFARRMMVGALVFPPLLGWLGMFAEAHGYLAMSSAWALSSIFMILLFTSVVWQSAESLEAAELALKVSELNYRTMSNSIPQLAWTADSSGNIDWYNQRWYDYTGTVFDQVRGWGWKEVMTPGALNQIAEKWRRAVDTGQDWEDILQLRARDGSYRWFLSRAIPIRDDDGHVVRWIGSNTDINEQIIAKQLLRESEEKYATLARALPQLIWTCRADGQCNYLSKQWTEYTGIAEQEQLGFEWVRKAIHPDDQTRTLEHWEGAVNEVHVLDMDYRIRRADGEYRWFTARGIPVRTDSGKISFWVGTCTDVHNQRLAAEELSEAKLIAERANYAKTQFLANMSHEIRTPIGAITGFTELLKDSSSSAADKQNYMMIIERNSKHLLRLIDDILDLSKVEAGKIAFENVNFSLPEFLADFESVMALKAAEKSIDFILRVDGYIPDQVCSDQLRLRQIIANVVGNAIKFTDHGSVEVAIDYQAPQLRISVEDTGPGISPDHMQNLFQTFSQADPSFKRKFGGTGLGLVLARRLAHLLGGDLIIAKTESGQGSTFLITVLLPAIEESQFVSYEHGEDYRVRGHAVKPKALGVLDGQRILLVEDSVDNRILITAYLSSVGAVVTEATDGIDGCQKAQQINPDVVIMDIQMPKMDGHEAMVKLRSQGFSKPIIALTAHAMREEREKCFSSGCSDYLTKPIDPVRLIEVLSKYAKPKNSA